jgi:hypothetical protein
MRYDIVDRLLDLWRSQPLFGAAGINMAVSINSPGQFQVCVGHNSEDHGFWRATLVFNALTL